MQKIRIALGSLVAASVLATTACGHHSAAGTANAEAKAKAIASSSANTQAEDVVKSKITSCINRTPTVKLATKAGRQQVISCLEGLVPPGKQDQLKQCVADTAAKDKVWTKAGRTAFANVGIAKCVTDVTGTSTASASAQPKPSASSGN